MDDETGGRHRERAAVLEVLEQAADPVLTLDEVADELGTSIRDARTRLEEMEENGMVQHKRGVWWAVPAPRLEGDVAARLSQSGHAPPLSIDEVRDIVCED